MNGVFKVIALMVLLQSCDSPFDSQVPSPDTTCDSLVFQDRFGVSFSDDELEDNSIYTSSAVFFYKYSLTDKSGLAGSIKVDGFTANDSIYISDSHEKILTYFTISGKDKLEKQESFRWDQSPMYVEYYNSDDEVLMSSQTGLVDNCKNVWMHPIRQGKFMQNYTSPWPFIKYDENEWNWNFIFNGTGWQNTVIDTWQDSMTVNYSYRIAGMDKYQLGEEQIDCYVIDAEGTSRLGNNSSHFLFNPKYGFVTTSSTNLDGSKSHIYLYKVENSK